MATVERAFNQQPSDFCDADSYCVLLRLDASERMGDAGLEFRQRYSTFGNSAIRAARGAALQSDFVKLCPELVEVIQAWPALSEAQRAAILAVARRVE